MACLDAGRELLASKIQDTDAQGFIWKQGRWLNRWKRRYFVLKGPVLYYFEADKACKPIKQSLGSFNLTVWRFEDHSQRYTNRPHAIRMVNPNSKTSFILAAKDPEDFRRWLAATKNAYFSSKYTACLPQITKCQAVSRGRTVRRRWQTIRRSVMLIQATYRMHLQRKSYKSVRANVILAQACVKRWRTRRDYKTIIRRRRIATELLATERSYVANLLTVVEMYYTPLLTSSGSATPILSGQQVMQVFGYVPQVHEVNNQLLQALESKIELWHSETKIGHLFCEHMDKLLVVYVPYVLNYGEAVELVVKLKKTSEGFKSFTDFVYEDPRSKGLDLSSLLIQPVQRLPRYELLLKDLIKFTNEKHPDYSDLCEALQRVVKVTVHINEKKRDKESVDSVSDLRSNLTGSLVSQVEWENYHRMIRKGEATCPVDDKVSYVFLLNEFLLLTQKQKSGYRLRVIVSLKDATVMVENNSELRLEKLKITLPANEQIAVHFPTADKAWSMEVLKVIEQLGAKNSPVTRAHASSSPLIISPKRRISRVVSLLQSGSDILLNKSQ